MKTLHRQVFLMIMRLPLSRMSVRKRPDLQGFCRTTNPPSPTVIKTLVVVASNEVSVRRPAKQTVLVSQTQFSLFIRPCKPMVNTARRLRCSSDLGSDFKNALCRKDEQQLYSKYRPIAHTLLTK